MEVTVGEHTYVIGKLKSREQRNVARRLSPLLVSARDLLKIVFETRKGGVTDILSASAPLAEALAEMSDENADYLFDTCLAVVKRKTSAGWQGIVVGHDLRYEDISVPDQVTLMFHVVQESLGNFTDALGGLLSVVVTKENPST